MDNENGRRGFIRKAALGGLMAAAIPEIIEAAGSAKMKKISIGKNNVILFQGDSITDSSRNRDDKDYNSPKALGSGYAMLAAAELLEKNPSLSLKIYNRGVSGNKVYQLAERWDEDCLQLKPDILSILIGVNDIWHKLDGMYNGTIETYRNDYSALIERTLKALPSVKLIIMEPFGVPGVQAVNEKWYPEFYDYQKAAREIAAKYGATFIPLQRIFDEAMKKAPGNYWTPDGVHPSLAGSQLMAKAWLTAVE